jgi:hypothetical protein
VLKKLIMILNSLCPGKEPMINMAATCHEHDGSACITVIKLFLHWFFYSCFIPRICDVSIILVLLSYREVYVMSHLKVLRNW